MEVARTSTADFFKAIRKIQSKKRNKHKILKNNSHLISMVRLLI